MSQAKRRSRLLQSGEPWRSALASKETSLDVVGLRGRSLQEALESETQKPVTKQMVWNWKIGALISREGVQYSPGGGETQVSQVLRKEYSLSKRKN